MDKLRIILFVFFVFNPILSLIFKFDYYQLISPIILVILCLLSFRRNKLVTIVLLVTIIPIMFYHFLNYSWSLGKIYNHMFWFVNAVFILLYFSNEKNIKELSTFLKKPKVKQYFIIYYFVLVLVLLFLFVTKLGFSYHWEGTYFQGNHASPHLFGYFMIYNYFIFNVIYGNNKKLFWISTIVVTFFILLTGARVVIISLIISFVLIAYNKYNLRKLLAILILLLVLLGVSLLIVGPAFYENIPIVNKFLRQLEYGQFDSGRILFTQILQMNFTSYPMLLKLIGPGADLTYYILLHEVGNEIWAHNDFLQIKYTFGYFGLIIWVLVVLKYVSYFRRKRINLLLILLLIVILGYVNGFYTYRDMILSIPFISVFILNNIKNK